MIQKLFRAGALLLLLHGASPALAGSATWLPALATGDWNTATNWLPATVPNGPLDTASFDLSTVTGVSISANTEVNGIAFNAGASPFTISASPSFTLTISGVGITNNSGLTQNFVTAVNGAGNIGQIIFANNATAGINTAFTTNGGTVSGGLGGFTQFFNTSTAGNGTFTHSGTTVSGAQGGVTHFLDTSTAGSGPGTLTVGLVVALSNGSLLNYELGVPGVIGMGVNDLVNVTGNLTLDGILNTTALGGFGPGSYRLFNYGGTLSDNTLDIGTVPADFMASNFQIVTGVPNEVDLLVLAGPSPGLMQFWDGPNTTANGMIDGGTGDWENFATNWTDAAGAVNSSWQNGIAVFAGSAGTVTLTQQIFFAGMVFMTDGYVIDASPSFDLNLIGSPAITTAVDVTATINAPIIGAGGITKEGLGTLILTGTNVFGGDTVVNNGTLKISLGGSVDDANGIVGNAVGSIGTATIDGVGSRWTNSGDLVVGDLGTGTLNITDGGSVSNVFGYVGQMAGSNGTALVDGAGSTWTNMFGVYVGYLGGTGMLTIQNGGAVSSDGGFIGYFTDSNGTMLVDGTASTWTNSSRVDVGFEGIGTLTISNGGAVSNFVGTIGSGTGHGTVLVNGVGSTWTNSNMLSVGDDQGSTGMLTVRNGGAVSNTDGFIGRLAGSNGTVLVDGPGSTWTNSGSLEVAEFGTGKLTIQNGGTVSNTEAIIASFAGSNGTVLVDGAGSTWTNTGSLGVAGILTIRNGGAVSSDSGFIDGTTLVDGSGSTWSNRSILEVGSVGTGTLTIQNGGSVASESGFIGFESNTNGTALVDGTGSSWVNSFSLDVGFIGDGTLNIINGGAVSSQDAGIGVRSGSSGIVIVDGAGSTWTNSGNLFVGGDALGPGGTGLLQIVNEGTVTALTTTIWDGSTVLDDASLISPNVSVMAGGFLGGSGTVFGDVTNAGIVSPGDSPGTLTLIGNYSQTGTGILQIEIAGLTLAAHDLLAIGGSATLAGNLQLVQLDNFIPHPGDTVTFLTAADGVSGTFATVDDAFSTATMLAAEVVYESNDVLIQFVQESFAGLAGLTPNQQTVATNLDEVVNDPRETALIEFLDSEALGNLPNDLDLIAPEELASIYEIGFSQATIQSINLQRRMDDIRAGSNGFSAAGFAMTGGKESYSGGKVSDDKKMLDKNPPSALIPAPDNRWGVFITGVGEFVNVDDEDFNARGYDITTGGFTLGVDYRVFPTFAIGLNTGYARSWADLIDGGRVTVDGGKLGLYATYFTGGFYLDTAVGGGYNSYDTRRSSLLGEARGNTDGGEFNALIGTGYNWKCGGLTFGPVATFQYNYVGLNGLTEEGSLAPLNFPDQSQDSVRSTLGAKASYECKVGRVIVRPEVRAAWQHEYGDQSYAIDSRFASGAGNIFTVHGPVIGRDSALIGAGVAVQWNQRTSTYLYYDGQFGRSNYDSQNISGGMRIAF